MLTSFEISHNIELQIDLKIINIQSFCENQTVHKLEKLFSFHSIYPFGWKVYTRPVGKKNPKFGKLELAAAGQMANSVLSQGQKRKKKTGESGGRGRRHGPRILTLKTWRERVDSRRPNVPRSGSEGQIRHFTPAGGGWRTGCRHLRKKKVAIRCGRHTHVTRLLLLPINGSKRTAHFLSQNSMVLGCTTTTTILLRFGWRIWLLGIKLN